MSKSLLSVLLYTQVACLAYSQQPKPLKMHNSGDDDQQMKLTLAKRLDSALVKKLDYTAVQLLSETTNGSAIHLPCSIATTKFLLQVDTGFQQLYLKRSLVEKLGLTSHGNAFFATAGSDMDATSYLIPRLTFAGQQDLNRQTPIIAYSTNDSQARNTTEINEDRKYGVVGHVYLASSSVHIDLESDTIYLRPAKRVVMPKLSGSWIVDKASGETNNTLEKVTITKDQLRTTIGGISTAYYYEISPIHEYDITSHKFTLICFESSKLNTYERSSTPIAFVELDDDKLSLCMALDHKKLKSMPRSLDAYKRDPSLVLYKFIRDKNK